jgi:hypothetical protein
LKFMNEQRRETRANREKNTRYLRRFWKKQASSTKIFAFSKKSTNSRWRNKVFVESEENNSSQPDVQPKIYRPTNRKLANIADTMLRVDDSFPSWAKNVSIYDEDSNAEHNIPELSETSKNDNSSNDLEQFPELLLKDEDLSSDKKSEIDFFEIIEIQKKKSKKSLIPKLKQFQKKSNLTQIIKNKKQKMIPKMKIRFQV